MRQWFFLGLVVGLVGALLIGPKAYKLFNKLGIELNAPAGVESLLSIKTKKVVTRFDRPLELASGKAFGSENSLTPELYRDGKFIADGKSGFAHQISVSYKDSAWLRSTKPLPRRYKMSVVIGEIDYGLEKISGLAQDPQYSEGPQNENGVYLLSITDVEPRGHHINSWWHQHRKLVIDVDNNVWGHGRPNPIFMVYFDRKNKLNCWNGKEWSKDWVKAATYDAKAWYRVEIERTWHYYILSVYSKNGQQLSRTSIPLSKVLHTDANYPEYFVTGDPHENYYSGAYKIKEVKIEY